ncbi:hypothetical protein TNCV_1459891 [Trichonephila clavipes]|nr:hypothetical protein TNCV_1459891 [Trichonephila clavipes]
MLCIRKKSLTACLTSNCFQSDFLRDSSSNVDTDESHLVRDQDCNEDGVVGCGCQWSWSRIRWRYAMSSSLSVIEDPPCRGVDDR